MNEHDSSIRPPDDVLVRFLDSQAAPPERARVERLAPGSAGRQRLWELREASSRFSDLVSGVGVPPLPAWTPAPRWTPSRALRAATVALLLFAGAAAAMPSSRAALSRALAAVGVGHRSDEAAIPPPPSSPVLVTFPAASTVLAVEVENRQSSGTISVRRTTGAAVTARAGPRSVLLVLPGRLVVRNATGARDELSLLVPATIATVTISVAGEETVVTVPTDGSTVRVPLGSPTGL